MKLPKNTFTVVIALLLAVNSLILPVTASVSEAESSSETYPFTGYLIDEEFAFTRLMGSDGPGYLPSSWDVQVAGGEFIGGYYSDFKIVDNSNVLPVTMKRDFAAQSEGKITLEFRFNSPSTIDGLKWQLRSGDTIGVSIYTDTTGSPNIYLDTAEGPVRLESYSANKEYGVKVIADITNNKADVYINGSLKASRQPFVNPVPNLDNFFVSSGGTSTGTFNFTPVKLYKGYIINERFISSVDNIPGDWTAVAAGGIISVEDMHAASKPDIYGLKMDASNATGNMEFLKRIPAQTGTIVLEYKALYPEKTDGIACEFLSGDATVFKMVTSGGNFCFIDEEGNIIPVYEYIKNLWYSIKLKIDTEAGKADIYINGKLKYEDASFASEVEGIDGIRFSVDSGNKGMVKLDDILVYHDYPLPDDYVPEPQVVSSDGYLVGIQSCSLWREGRHQGWDRINPYPERKPLLGYYDEGNPETADWEIKWLAEHGIDFQMFFWFRTGYNQGYPIKEPELTSALNEGYFNAKYSDKIKFMISWENANEKCSGSQDFRGNIVPYWMEYYIKDPRYLVIDNKPVIAIHNYERFRNVVGGSAQAVRAELEYLREECRKSGFDGAILLTCYTGASAGRMAEMKEAGFEGFYAYSWMGIEGEPEYQQVKLLQQKAAMEASGDDPIDMIPILAMGRDDRPWGGPAGYAATPEQFEQTALWIRDNFMPGLNEGSLGRNMILLDNWNEYGEGHYIMPANLAGFGYLDVVRDVFSEGGEHEDVVPTQNQLERINVLYPRDRILREKHLEVPEHTGSYTNQWNFDNDGDCEGWNEVTNQISSINVADGILSFTSTGSDPWLVSPDNLGFEASEHPYIHIRMKNNALDVNGKIYFITEADPNWNEDKSVAFAVFPEDSGFRDYYVNMTNNQFWTGTVKQFRIDPVTTTGDIEIDFIGVENCPIQGVKTFVDGQLIKLTDKTQVIDNCPMLAAEEFFKYMNLRFQWNGNREKFVAVKDGSIYEFIPGLEVMYKDGDEVGLEKAPVILGDVFYVPASFLEEAFGYILSWNEQAQELSIYTSEVVWDFNTDDGWTANNRIEDTELSDGYYNGSSQGTAENGEEGFITSRDGLKIDAASVYRIRVNYRNSSPGNQVKLYFTTSGDKEWDTEKMMVLPAVPSDSDYREYVFDTYSFEKWDGTIEQIRLVPTNASGDFSIDYIKLEITPEIRILGDNLINDPGMELGDNSQIKGWATVREYTYSDAYSGVRSLKITKTENYGSLRFDNTNIVNGQEYYYSAWVRLDEDTVSKNNPPKMSMWLQYMSPQDGTQKQSNIFMSGQLSTAEWRHVSTTYTVTSPDIPNVNSLLMWTDQPTDKDVWYLDNMEIRPVYYKTDPAWVYVSGISLDNSFIVLDPGQVLKLEATVHPENAVNKDVVWSSDNPDAAVVDAYGYVYAKSEGTATIRAATKEGGFAASCEVIVGTAVPVTGVELDKSECSLLVGESVNLTASVLPSDASYKKVSWSISDPGVAELSEPEILPDGAVKITVTAKNTGTAVVTVTTLDGSKTAECIINVSTNPKIMTESLISDVLYSDIHHGIKNSLVKKLENALDSIMKGNMQSSVNQLKAFINETKAQKGKKIPPEKADMWIITANDIISEIETEAE